MPFFELKSVEDDLILKNRYGIYSKKELEGHLKNGYLTVRELGNLYGLNTSKLQNVLRSLNLSYRNILCHTRVSDISVSPSMHQVLLGTLLGDAYMKNPRIYELSHGLNQYDYLYHVAEQLHPFVASVGDKDVGSPVKKSLSFWTYSHDVFPGYFSRFYFRGKQKKFITEESVHGLDPMGLAYWYQDDGKFNRGSVYLCVGNIPVESGNILVKFLLDRFGLSCTLQSQNNEKGYFNIYVKSGSQGHFFELVRPYIIPSMKYKIGIGTRPVVQFEAHAISRRHYNFCELAGRSVRYFGDCRVLQELAQYPQIKSPKQKYIEGIKGRIRNGSQISRTAPQMPAKEEVLKLLEKGNTDEQIGAIYGVSRETIGRLRRGLNIKRRKCRMTEDQQRSLTEFLKKGIPITQAMKELKMSYYTIKSWYNSKGK